MGLFFFLSLLVILFFINDFERENIRNYLNRQKKNTRNGFAAAAAWTFETVHSGDVKCLLKRLFRGWREGGGGVEREREESEDDSSGIQSEWEGLDSVQSGPTTKLQVCVKRLKGRRRGGGGCG